MIDVTNAVNQVYSKKTPSIYFRNEQDIEPFVNNRKLFLLRMKLPPKLFVNSSLIDFGCGMGQNTLVYDHLGSNCTLLEYDNFSYNNALMLFEKHAKHKFRIINTDIFNYDIQKERFDFVVSNGVAHHTKDPAQSIQLCCTALKSGGFFLLGIGNKAGFFQRNLQRFILYSIANNDAEIVKYSKLLFREHLRRSVRFSGRKLDEVIYDTYINPKIYAFGTAELLRIFSKNNIQLYSSYQDIKDVENFVAPGYNQFRLRNPSTDPTQDSISEKGIFYSDIEDISLSNNNKIHTRLYQKLRSLAPHFDAITDEVNDINFNDFDINKTEYLKKINTYKEKLLKIEKIDFINKTHNEIFFDELSAVITVLNKRSKKIDKLREIAILLKGTKKLFRSINGVGMNYYCGYKN